MSDVIFNFRKKPNNNQKGEFMLLNKMIKNKVRCPICGKFIKSSIEYWGFRSKPGDDTNSLNNFFWCCKNCISDTSYWDMYCKDYRIVALSCVLFDRRTYEMSPVLKLKPYYDSFLKV